jgi:WD40 repeat protein
MNQSAEQVRELLHEVAHDVPVPPYDEVALRRAVRRSRRRRTGAKAGGAAAVGVLVAGLVVAVGAVAPEAADRPEQDTPPVAAQPEPVETLKPSELLTEPLYYTAQGRLRALTPDGTVHDLGLRSEAVVGATREGVLALGDDSRLVWFDASSTGEGGRAFSRGESPVDGAVQSVALSGDGRYLAWIDPDGVLRVRDLQADLLVTETGVPENTYVASVAEDRVLLSEDGDLVLRTADAAIPVPTAQDGYGWQSDVGGDRVSVMDRDGVTRVYDVSSGKAELAVAIPGSGRLAPGGAAVVTAHVGGPAVRLWTGDGLAPLLALDDGQRAEGVAWLDEDHAVVTSGSRAGTTVRVCAIATRACDEVLTSKDDVRLGD